MAEHVHNTPTPVSASSIAGRRRLLSGLAGFGFAGAAEAIAAPVDAPASEHPDAYLLSLLAEYTALELEIYPPKQSPMNDQDARDRAAKLLRARQKALIGPLCAIRAHTLDGMRARIRAIMCLGNDLTDEIDKEDDTHSSFHDERLMLALLRDLAAEDAA